MQRLRSWPACPHSNDLLCLRSRRSPEARVAGRAPAARRLAAEGANELAGRRLRQKLLEALRSVANPLVVILLVAGPRRRSSARRRRAGAWGELLRAGKVRGIQRLDALLETFEYLPLSTEVMRDAASLWADVRRRGLPTADPKALDADMILAAQARRMDAAEVVIATTNVQHLSRLADAKPWQEVFAG